MILFASLLLGIVEISILSTLGGLLFIGLFLFLYFTCFTHFRLKKNTKDLTSSFETDHSLLFGQDAQFVKRLETISSMNLVYVDEYSHWKKAFQSIRDVEDASAQASVNSLRDLVSARRYKDLKEYLPKAREIIQGYHEKVQSLDNALKKKFQEEDDVRAFAIKVKENYRDMKQAYFSKQEQLTLVSESFDRLFKKIDSLFEESDDDIENARYNEAETSLKEKIAPIVLESGKILQSLPNISITITNIIPDKISSLRNRYEEMSSKGYPLNHILLKGHIGEMEEELKAIAENVKALRLNGVEKELDDILREIEGYFDAFDKEVSARAEFEVRWTSIYEKENELETAFYSLNHSLPKVRKIYLINSDDDVALETIKNSIEKASNAKRSLDTYIHSGTKQPYSVLLEKLDALKNESDAAEANLKKFNDHLNGLKEITNKAMMGISFLSSRFENAEETIHGFALSNIERKAMSLLENLYAQIDDINEILRTTPINALEVERRYSKLVEEGERFLSEVEKTKTNMEKAEKNILFANRYRANDAAVDNALLQSENFFYKGDFANSIATSENVLHSKSNGNEDD
ncbi:MAG TPA: hypothetical protein DCZ41_02575 [Firmicutes bacterium]|nr:hypothetical protein [Bacillota bacterium]